METKTLTLGIWNTLKKIVVKETGKESFKLALYILFITYRLLLLPCLSL